MLSFLLCFFFFNCCFGVFWRRWIVAKDSGLKNEWSSYLLPFLTHAERKKLAFSNLKR